MAPDVLSTRDGDADLPTDETRLDVGEKEGTLAAPGSEDAAPVDDVLLASAPTVLTVSAASVDDALLLTDMALLATSVAAVVVAVGG
jgi:hypothetical protein